MRKSCKSFVRIGPLVGGFLQLVAYADPGVTPVELRASARLYTAAVRSAREREALSVSFALRHDQFRSRAFAILRAPELPEHNLEYHKFVASNHAEFVDAYRRSAATATVPPLALSDDKSLALDVLVRAQLSSGERQVVGLIRRRQGAAT